MTTALVHHQSVCAAGTCPVFRVSLDGGWKPRQHHEWPPGTTMRVSRYEVRRQIKRKALQAGVTITV